MTFPTKIPRTVERMNHAPRITITVFMSLKDTVQTALLRAIHKALIPSANNAPPTPAAGPAPNPVEAR